MTINRGPDEVHRFWRDLQNMPRFMDHLESVQATGDRTSHWRARPIAGISLDADAARLLAWRCADLIDRGEPFGVAASKAKLFASEAAVRAANSAIQVHGGAGYVDDFPVAKYLRDARVMTLYEGTSQVQKLIIGRAETGISAFV